MWLSLANGVWQDEMEQVLSQLEAIVQFTEELQRRFSGNGVDGVEGTLGLYRRLQSVLDTIPGADLTQLRADVATLEGCLARMAGCLQDITRLKRVVGA